MKHSTKALKDQVIVITGASSGIGLRTAQLCAERGACVVLVARNDEALTQAVSEIQASGGKVAHFAADVSDPAAVERAANFALNEFGAIDTWINNAGVGIYGLSEEVPLSEARHLFDTNFWGVVHGTRTALHLLRDRGGQIINMGSIESERAVPFHSFYAASKHAIKGYTDAVRIEIEKQKLPIWLSLIKPASINTPFIDHSVNHLKDAAPRYMSPTYSVDVAARAIVECIESPRREVTIGASGKAIEFFDHFAPRFMDLVMEMTAFRGQKRADRPTGQKNNLHAPLGDEGNVSGTQNGWVSRSSLTTTASLHPWRALVVAVAVGGLSAWALKRRENLNLADLPLVGSFFGPRNRVSEDQVPSWVTAEAMQPLSY